MSVEKAKEFIEYVKGNPELQKIMSGFSVDDLKAASAAMKESGELSESELGAVAGGGPTLACRMILLAPLKSALIGRLLRAGGRPDDQCDERIDEQGGPQEQIEGVDVADGCCLTRHFGGETRQAGGIVDGPAAHDLIIAQAAIERADPLDELGITHLLRVKDNDDAG